jgi:hypothetical protein
MNFKRIYKCKCCNLIFESLTLIKKENPHTGIPHEHICDKDTIGLGEYIGYRKYSNNED